MPEEIKGSKEEAVALRANRWKVLWRLLAIARPEYVKIALGLVGLSINAVTNLSFPWLIGKALDQASYEDLTAFLLKNSYFFMAGTFASWLRIYCFGSAAESIANRLRMEIFESFMQQDMHFYESLEMGEVATLLENDVNTSAELLTEKVGSLLRSLNSSINGSVSLYSTSPQLCTITLSIVPVVGIAAMTLSRYSRKLANKFRDQQSKLLSYSIERIRGISTVRLNHREVYEQDKFKGLLNDANTLALKRFHAQGGFMSFVNLFTNFSLVAVLHAGGSLVSQGKLTVGSLTSFAIQSGFVGLGFSGLSTFYGDLMKGLDAAARIFRILDMPRSHHATTPAEVLRIYDLSSKSPSNKQLALTNSPSKSSEGIRLENVSFTYQSRPDVCVLDSLSLHIKPRQITVIVGASGSGKSTLFSILSGLYRPTVGRVSFFGDVAQLSADHQDAEGIERSKVHALCGAVEQSSAALLTGTIRENIAYGLPVTSTITGEEEEREVTLAATAAHADDFIRHLPKGYEEDIGSGGCLLSGGQRARIALARALVKRPRYLVLDEPTAALDASSEQAVLQPLLMLKSTTTIVIFTHSETLRQMADTVFELSEGKLTEVSK